MKLQDILKKEIITSKIEEYFSLNKVSIEEMCDFLKFIKNDTDHRLFYLLGICLKKGLPKLQDNEIIQFNDLAVNLGITDRIMEVHKKAKEYDIYLNHFKILGLEVSDRGRLESSLLKTKEMRDLDHKKQINKLIALGEAELADENEFDYLDEE